MPNIWDRQPAESGEAYAAFQIFLNLGPNRSLDAAYRVDQEKRHGPIAASPTDKPKRAAGGWKKWHRQHTWRERALAHDTQQSTVANEAEQKVVAEKSDELTRRRLALEDRESGILDRMAEKIDEMLNVGLIRRKVIKNDKGDVIQIFEPIKFNMRSLVDAIKAYTVLKRLQLGLPYKLEDAKEPVPEDLFFTTSGQFAESMPKGAVHPMPADISKKPDIDGAKAVANNAPQKPQKARPA